MRRIVLLLTVAMLLVLAIVVANRGPGPELPADTSGVATGGPELAADRAAADAHLAAHREDAERREAVGQPLPVTPPPTTGSLIVVVRDAGTLRPVAGAEVAVLDMGALGWALDDADTTMHEPAGRRLRQALAHRATTDEHGEARVAVPEGRLMVEARCEGRYGFAMARSPAENDRVEVRIDDDRSLRVQVVDAAGGPRAGVPVALRRQIAAPPGRRFSAQHTKTEPPDGTATFEHFQRRLSQGDGWHATFAFPVRGEPAVPADAHTPATPPLRLALPPTGSLHITVRGAAGEIPPLDRISLRLAARADGVELWPDGPWSRPHLDPKTGTADLPWLGLGLEVTVTARRGAAELTSATVAGPGRAGETAVCELVLDPQHAFARVVRGRFVLADGTPWPACEVTAWLRLRPITLAAPSRQELAVDENGRFELTVEQPLPANGSRSYDLLGNHPDGTGQVGVDLELDEEIPPEGLDVGDVCLDHGALLAAGRVLGFDRQPLAGAHVRLHRRTLIDENEYWPSVRTSGTWRTKDDGTFHLYLRRDQDDPGTELRLFASCDGHAPVRDQPVVCGDTDVIVLLPGAGEIAGSLALADGVAREDLIVALRGEAPADGMGPLRIVTVEKDGAFTVSDLPAGAWNLTVQRRGVDNRPESRPAVTVEGLQVQAGATCRDPRIQQVPIAPIAASLTITVVDPTSTPIPNATVAVAGAENPRAAEAGRDGICRVRTETLPVDLDVTAFGHRPQRLLGVDGDRRVVMQAGIPVVLRCGTQPNGIDPVWQLAVYLQDVGADGVARRMTYGSAYPWDKRYFDAKGELALSLPAPGIYECAAHVFVSSKGVGRGGRVELPSQPRITVVESTTAQVFELRIPRDAVARAVARASR